MAPQADDEMEQFFQLFAKINMINNHVTAQFAKVLPHNMSLAQFSILTHLHKRPGEEKTPLDLASHFLLRKSSVGEALEKLSQKGFVVLTKNAKDGRSKIVTITPAGSKARQDSVAAIRPFLRAMSDAVGRDTLHAAADDLSPIREWLRNQR